MQEVINSDSDYYKIFPSRDSCENAPHVTPLRECSCAATACTSDLYLKLTIRTNCPPPPSTPPTYPGNTSKMVLEASMIV